MQPLDQPRIDPAPSRWSYRLHRLMLTPLFRLLLRVGVPFCFALGVTGLYLSDQERRDRLNIAVSDLRNSIETRPEFMVNLMAVEGAGPEVSEDIREILPIDFPVSSFDLDLEVLRSTVEGLDPVASATVRIRPGGVLQVDVKERVPVVLWRTRDGLELLDRTGTYVGPAARRADRLDLPLIAGEGADAHVSQALELLAAAAPVGPRLRGLVYVGQRRWDVVLDRGQRIQLPVTRPVPALERVVAMDQVQDLLARDLAVVDMRLAHRPTLRMNDNALREMWRIKGVLPEDEQD